MSEKIKVMVVDDSAFMRRIIQNLLEQDPEIEVVGYARDGMDALKKAGELNPDVITLDVEMPVMDGHTTLQNLQKQGTHAVIMVSSHTQTGEAATIRALELGAFDFISKPERLFDMPSDDKRLELVNKVKLAHRSKQKVPGIVKIQEKTPSKLPVSNLSATSDAASDLKYIIAIGISTGGPRALANILPQFPADLPAAVVVVQHMPPGFTRSLAKRLDETCPMNVKEAEDQDELKAGWIYVAPGDFHLNFSTEGRTPRIVLTTTPPQGGFRPSVDVMMQSLAASGLNRIIGVIMTGMGSDGCKGLKELKAKKKAHIIAQDESTSIVFGMPKAAIEAGIVDDIVPLSDIPSRILSYMGGHK